jgi:hypothetical protein
MKIFNLKQADIFIRKGAKVIGTGTGNRYKVYIEFEENTMFEELMKRWLNKEF